MARPLMSRFALYSGNLRVGAVELEQSAVPAIEMPGPGWVITPSLTTPRGELHSFELSATAAEPTPDPLEPFRKVGAVVVDQHGDTYKIVEFDRGNDFVYIEGVDHEFNEWVSPALLAKMTELA